MESSLTQQLGKLNARDGKLSVLGNHDYWVGDKIVKKILNDSGFQDITIRFSPSPVAMTIYTSPGAIVHT